MARGARPAALQLVAREAALDHAQGGDELAGEELAAAAFISEAGERVQQVEIAHDRAVAGLLAPDRDQDRRAGRRSGGRSRRAGRDSRRSAPGRGRSAPGSGGGRDRARRAGWRRAGGAAGLGAVELDGAGREGQRREDAVERRLADARPAAPRRAAAADRLRSPAWLSPALRLRRCAVAPAGPRRAPPRSGPPPPAQYQDASHPRSHTASLWHDRSPGKGRKRPYPRFIASPPRRDMCRADSASGGPPWQPCSMPFRARPLGLGQGPKRRDAAAILLLVADRALLALPALYWGNIAWQSAQLRSGSARARRPRGRDAGRRGRLQFAAQPAQRHRQADRLLARRHLPAPPRGRRRGAHRARPSRRPDADLHARRAIYDPRDPGPGDAEAGDGPRDGLGRSVRADLPAAHSRRRAARLLPRPRGAASPGRRADPEPVIVPIEKVIRQPGKLYIHTRAARARPRPSSTASPIPSCRCWCRPPAGAPPTSNGCWRCRAPKGRHYRARQPARLARPHRRGARARCCARGAGPSARARRAISRRQRRGGRVV